jgi:hypothetical protein
MKLRLASAVVAAALLAGACGDQSHALATVNGAPITSDFMASLRVSYRGGIDVDTEGFRNDLSGSIFQAAIAQQAESQFGLAPAEDDIDDRLVKPPERWRGMFLELEADADTTDAYARTQAKLSILRDEVSSALIRAEDGFIEGILADTPQNLTNGCMRHILVGTRSEADAVIERLRAGEDFVAVAHEVTTDTASGGEPVGGCPVSFAGLTPPVALAAVAAPLNQAFGPVESEFGFHVILVEQRVDPPTADQVAADPTLYLPGSVISGFFTPWFNEAVRNSEITVAEAVGRWSTAGIGIIPPGQ